MEYFFVSDDCYVTSFPNKKCVCPEGEQTEPATQNKFPHVAKAKKRFSDGSPKPRGNILLPA